MLKKKKEEMAKGKRSEQKWCGAWYGVKWLNFLSEEEKVSSPFFQVFPGPGGLSSKWAQRPEGLGSEVHVAEVQWRWAITPPWVGLAS